MARQFANNRNDAPPFFFQGHWKGARTARFAAHVENVGAVGDEFQRVLDGLVGRVVPAPVGKTVRSHVDDAHDQRAPPLQLRDLGIAR